MDNRKKVVAEHALALFVEHGVANTSIQQIIKRANISKGTFYNYFSSKTECIEAILENARYDAALMRAELMIGKDERDINVLEEQIGVLSQINRKRGLDVVFEELLYSGDQELKEIVLRQRLAEIEWFASRLVDIYGEDTRAYAFEAAIIFYGMTQNLLFLSKLINQNTFPKGSISGQTLHYLDTIVHSLKNEHTAVLDVHKINAFTDLYSSKTTVSREEVEDKLIQLLKEKLQPEEQQLVEAVLEEYQAENPRFIVMNALLKAMNEQFNGSLLEAQVKTIASYVWYSIKQY